MIVLLVVACLWCPFSSSFLFCEAVVLSRSYCVLSSSCSFFCSFFSCSIYSSSLIFSALTSFWCMISLSLFYCSMLCVYLQDVLPFWPPYFAVVVYPKPVVGCLLGAE